MHVVISIIFNISWFCGENEFDYFTYKSTHDIYFNFLRIERASTDIEHFKKYLILEHKSLGYV